jgi:hypothetical protein
VDRCGCAGGGASPSLPACTPSSVSSVSRFPVNHYLIVAVSALATFALARVAGGRKRPALLLPSKMAGGPRGDWAAGERGVVVRVGPARLACRRRRIRIRPSRHFRPPASCS